MEGVQDICKILKLLPHRYPFLLVDRVLKREQGADPASRVGQKVVALKNVTFNEPFFNGHFPDFPIMPGVLQIEAMAQVAALAFTRDDDPPMDFFIAAIQEARFRKPVTPGDSLIITVEITKDRRHIILADCKIHVEDRLVAEAEIMASVNPKTKS